jgi:predicted nucleic acid-binding Zn ribbon protein
MPTYEYECEAGHTFEEVQSIKDDPIKECPVVIPFSGPDHEKCGAPAKRLISKTSFVLKGGGWFKDGY